MASASSTQRPKAPLIYNPQVRGIAYQVVLCAAIVFLAWSAIHNAAENLARAKIASGFGFWDNTAGFDISQTLIDYSTTSTYGRAFWVGLINTLLVAGVGIVLATFWASRSASRGCRRTGSWRAWPASTSRPSATSRCCCNCCSGTTPCSRRCPTLRESLAIPGGGFLNNRGLFLPQPVFQPGSQYTLVALGRASLPRSSTGSGRGAGRWRPASRRRCSGSRSGSSSGCRLLCWRCPAFRSRSTIPEAGRFNIRGGMEVLPEFMALLFGLAIYTAAFIAEVVRAGIRRRRQGPDRSRLFAGLRPGPTLRLVVIPQAMRVIIPPLTSQYLNLTKNSTLAVAIGYPDLVQIFAGTVLNQTGQAVEVIVITMAVYLTISLVTSALMNLYNRRMALVER